MTETARADAAEVRPASTSARISFNIPRQPLSDALTEWSRQSGLQVLRRDTDNAEELTAPPVSGEYSPAEALELMLADSGFRYEFVNDRTVRIAAKSTASAAGVSFRLAGNAPSTAGGDQDAASGSGGSSDSAVAGDDRHDGAVDEITITAKRRATTATKFDLKVLDTPQSIKAVTSDVLNFASVREFTDLAKVDASTAANGVYGGVPRISMRGFNNSTDNGIKVDGIPALHALPLDFGVFERIEILKGPTSTLYGQNAVGGLLNAVSKKPLSVFKASLNLQGGSWDFRRIEGDAGGPVTRDGALTFRTYGAYQEGGEFVDFTRNYSRVVYGALQYAFSETTSATFSVDYQNRSYTPQYGINLGLDLKVPDVPATRFFNLPWTYRDTEYVRTKLEIDHRLANDWSLKVAAQYEHGKASGTDGAACGLLDADGFIVGDTCLPEIYGEWTSITQSQQAFEASLTGPFELWGRDQTLFLSADVREHRRDYNYIYDFEMGPLNIYHPDYSALAAPRPRLSDWLCADCFTGSGILANRTRVSGLTAQLLLHPTDRLSVLAGGRLDKTKVTNRSWDASVVGNVFVKTADTETEGVIDTSQTISQAGVTYALRPRVNLYANWSQSFNPQSGLTFEGQAINPEQGVQYELGIKADLSELTATLALFDMKRSHIVGTNPVHPQFQEEVGSQKSKGVELDVFGNILPGWSVYASYAYIDGHITASDQLEDIGSRMIGVPRNSLSIYSFYQLQQGALKGLGFGGGVVSKQDIVWGLPSVSWWGRQVDAGGYTTADARVYYQMAHLTFDLKVNNVFDEKYYQTVDFGMDGVFAGRPREYIFGVKYDF